MNIRIITEGITIEEAREIAREFYTDMVKGVVDIEREIVALGGEYHMDANQKLTESGSRQKDIWGFNFYVDKGKEERLEYTSLINIRPVSGNKSMVVEDENVRVRMKKIINSKIL